MLRQAVLGICVTLPAIAVLGQTPAEQKAVNPLHPRVKLETTLGDITLELDAEKAPITVDNFVRYAADGFYNGTIFHRVISNFMIQGGGYTPDMEEKKEGLRPPIRNEWRNGLKNVRGTIAMARTQVADSATSQFFINVVDNKSLDVPRDGAAYAVFGRVTEGMEVVDRIKDSEVTEHPKLAMGKVVPVEPVVIKSVTLLDGLSYAQVAAAIQAAQQAEAEACARRARSFQELMEKGVDESGNKLHKSPTGLMYVVLQEGSGPSPGFIEDPLRGKSVTDWFLENKDAKALPRMNMVEIRYNAWLLDGTEFDNSQKRGGSVTFPLNASMMKGLVEGISLMKVGGKHRLIIPGELGYGERGSRDGAVPPNATVVYDVTLVTVR